MGAGNVSRVYKEWSCLEHRPFRALAYMALVSMDRDDPPKYWGGRDDLAVALGYPMPEAPADDNKGQSATDARAARARGHHAVDKVTQSLVKQGAVLRIRQGSFRSHAVFALLFSATEGTPQGSPTASKVTPQGSSTKGRGTEVTPQGCPTPLAPTPEVTPQGSPRSPLRGPVGHPSGVVEGTPQGSPKEYEEKEGGSEGMRGRPAAGPIPKATLKRLPAASPDMETERRRQSEALQKRIRDFAENASV